jgi:predicted  nucleic acid-binding Zn-ribbon protein
MTAQRRRRRPLRSPSATARTTEGDFDEGRNRRSRQGDRGAARADPRSRRTGALTQRDQSEKQSVEELQALLSKLQERRNSLEAEALDLNGRIVKLAYLKEERSQTRSTLTRPAVR